MRYFSKHFTLLIMKETSIIKPLKNVKKFKIIIYTLNSKNKNKKKWTKVTFPFIKTRP